MSKITKTYYQLTKDELYEILSLRSRIFVEEQCSPFNDVDGDDKNAIHVLLTNEENEIKAYARIIPGNPVKIGRVLAVERRKGLGTEVMKYAIDAAVNVLGAGEILIEAQTTAKEFYKKLGFAECGFPFDDCGVEHVEMKLYL